MPLDPSTERERVHRRYPPFGSRDVISWIVALAATFLWVRGDWSTFAGVAVVLTIFAVGGVMIRAKLRKNADAFARRPGPVD